MHHCRWAAANLHDTVAQDLRDGCNAATGDGSGRSDLSLIIENSYFRVLLSWRRPQPTGRAENAPKRLLQRHWLTGHPLLTPACCEVVMAVTGWSSTSKPPAAVDRHRAVDNVRTSLRVPSPFTRCRLSRSRRHLAGLQGYQHPAACRRLQQTSKEACKCAARKALLRLSLKCDLRPTICIPLTAFSRTCQNSTMTAD